MVSGDSLWGISQRFEVSIPRLRELNGLTRASTLHPGDVLVISDGTLEVEPVSAVQAVGDTFLGRTYAPHVTASANENLRLLRSVPQPTPEQMQQIVRETAERMGVDPRLAWATRTPSPASAWPRSPPATPWGRCRSSRSRASSPRSWWVAS